MRSLYAMSNFEQFQRTTALTIRDMSARGILAGLLVICLSRAAVARCIPQKITLNSATGHYAITVDVDTTVTVRDLPADTIVAWKMRYGDHPHHMSLVVDPHERVLVIADSYEGIWFYSLKGEFISFRDGDSFMTMGHERKGQFACHKEGHW